MRHPLTVGGRRNRPWWLALTVAAVGGILIAVAVAAQQSAPHPPRSVGRIEPPTSMGSGGPSSGAVRSAAPTGKQPLRASRPLAISIASIDVHSRLRAIGLAADGTLAVPQPGPDLNKAAWFRGSPTPGQLGPSVIEGHVDSTSGPSVFFRLGAVRPGDKIHVTRADGIETVFTVDAVRDYPKVRFPTRVVYGVTDLDRPELRLITCSDFDAAIGHHTGNEVVFAHLTAAHRIHT
jgi:Sortase domain